MTLSETLAGVTLVCIGLQLYHYLGYPAILAALAAVVVRPPRPPDSAAPLSTSLIICAYNEAGVIESKLANSLKLEPQPDEIIVVDDGSVDGTGETVLRAIPPGASIQVLSNPERGGKSAAMNFGAAAAQSDVLVFSDATEIYDLQAIRWLLAEFADPTVAVASGAHRLRPPERALNGNLVGKSEGLYWHYEEFIRRNESKLGATVASVGSMLAIRRKDWQPLPAGTVNDDAWLTMATLARGRNVRFAHNAVSWETANEHSRSEHVRRRRIAAGRLMLLRRSEVWPWRRPAVLAAFLSHKVLRLALPLLMIGGAASNLAVVLLEPSRTFFVALLALQVAAAALAIAGYLAERIGRKWQLAHVAYHIVQSNLMVLAAMRDVIAGRAFQKWDKPTR